MMQGLRPDPQVLDQEIVKSFIKSLHTFEPAVLHEDIDYHRMRAVVRLKRKLVTGAPPRQKAPANLSKGFHGQEAQSPLIFECPVLHWKNKYGLNRIRYKKGDDVTVIFSHRAKDELIKRAHEFNIDPVHKRMLHLQDAYVLLGLMCDENEPKAPKDHSDELGLNHIEMGQDDWVHYWGRFGTEGWGARIYTTPQGDHVIHPRMGRHVWLEERARWKILFAEPCAYDSFNPHTHVGSAGPGTDGPPLVVFHFIPLRNWSPWHHVDLPQNF